MVLQNCNTTGTVGRRSPNWGVVNVRAVWQCTKGQLNREFTMSFKKATLAAMLAVSMTSTPVLAQTAAAPASDPAVRSGADMEDANSVRGGFIIPLLALLAVIAGILALVSDGGDDPVSP